MVLREAAMLLATDRRLFGPCFGTAQMLALATNENLAERRDAFVARFGRLRDTLGAALPPHLLEAMLEPAGTMPAARWRQPQGLTTGTLNPSKCLRLRVANVARWDWAMPAIWVSRMSTGRPAN